MSSLYEQNLWNKIDFLHERYTRHHTYMSHFLDIMSRYHQACFDFSKSIKNIISKNYSLSDDESSTWNNSMKSFINCLSSHSQLFLQTSENIKNTIIDPITKSLQEHSLKEKDTYMTYNKTRNIYNNLKNSLDKAHKEFELKAKDSENLVYNSKKAKLQNLGNPEQLAKMEAKATDALTSATMCEEKYMNIIDDANKARENETLLQKKTHNFYETCDNYYYTQIKSVIGFNITNLKQMASSIKMEIIDLTDRFDRLSLENDIKEFIEKNKSDAKPDSNIEFIPYVPCPELSKRSSSKSLNKQEIADFDIKCEVVSTFKKYFKNIRADLNMVEEKNKNTMRNLIGAQSWRQQGRNSFEYHHGGQFGNFANGTAFMVHSKQELDSIKQQIVSYCDANNARAYITCNPRSESAIKTHLANLGKKFGKRLNPWDQKFGFEHMAGQAKPYGPNWTDRIRFFLDIDTKKNAYYLPSTKTNKIRLKKVTDKNGKEVLYVDDANYPKLKNCIVTIESKGSQIFLPKYPNQEQELISLGALNVWNETKNILNQFGVPVETEYETPSGGLHVVIADISKIQDVNGMEKALMVFDDDLPAGMTQLVHLNMDGKLILYSNVDTAGY